MGLPDDGVAGDAGRESIVLGHNAQHEFVKNAQGKFEKKKLNPVSSAVIIGKLAKGRGNSATAIGESSEAGEQGTAVGNGAKALGHSALAGGFNANASGTLSVALGGASSAKGEEAVSIGSKSNASGDNAIAIGPKAKATLLNGIALGNEANADRVSIAIGHGAYVGKQVTTPNTVGHPGYNVDRNPWAEEYIIYQGITLRQSNAIAMGLHTKAFGFQTMALGSSAEAYNTNSAAIGLAAKAQGDFAFAVGHQAQTNGKSAAAFGRQANAAAKEALALGSFSMASLESAVALGAYSVANIDKGVLGYDAQGRYADNAAFLGDKQTEFDKFKSTISTAETKHAALINEYHAIIDRNDEIVARRREIAKRTDEITQALKKEGITADETTALNTEKATLQTEDGKLNTERKDIGSKMGNKLAEIAAEETKIADAKKAMNTIKDGYATWISTAAAVSVGNKDLGITRQITGVAAGTADTDAVNVAQLKGLAENNVYVKNGAPQTNENLTALSSLDLNKLRFSFDNGIKADVQDGWIKVSLDNTAIQNNTALKGKDGESAFASWQKQPGNENKTEADFANMLSEGAGNYAAISTEVNSQKQKLTEVQADVSKVKSDVTQVQADVKTQKQELQKVNNQVTHNTADLQQLRTEHDSLKAQMHNDRAAIQQLDRKMNKMNKELHAGIAAATAMANIPTSSVAGETILGVGVGSFKGQSSVAVGYSTTTDNNKIIFKVSGGATTQGDVNVGGGVGFKWK